MPLNVLDAAALRQVVTVFRDALGDHREAVNNLNVYPVPDGDTGTNMSLTLRSVVDELDGADPDMASVCKACLLYTSPSPRDPKTSRMPSSA